VPFGQGRGQIGEAEFSAQSLQDRALLQAQLQQQGFQQAQQAAAQAQAQQAGLASLQPSLAQFTNTTIRCCRNFKLSLPTSNTRCYCSSGTELLLTNHNKD